MLKRTPDTDLNEMWDRWWRVTNGDESFYPLTEELSGQVMELVRERERLADENKRLREALHTIVSTFEECGLSVELHTGMYSGRALLDEKGGA